MLEWQKAHDVQDRFDKLLPEHFMQPNKGFKLRGSAAQVRAMVPFAMQLADELLSPAIPEEQALRFAATHLNNIYSCLSSSAIFPVDIAQTESTKFALQYVALSDRFNPRDNRCFRIKPKLHLFLHICQDGSKPSMYWFYRDEDWGGSVARFSRRRGGLLSAQSLSRNVLDKFVENQPLIRIA
jgi:hypothetical protein